MEIIELPRHQSESLLRSGVAGRVAVCTPEGPHIVPVNYSVVDQSVVIRTHADGLLATQAPGSVIAFEVDQFDYENGRGWSVIARGLAHQVTDIPELSHVLAMWEPRPWVDGPRPVYLRFTWSEISGRRLGAHWSIEKNLSVNRWDPVAVRTA